MIRDHKLFTLETGGPFPLASLDGVVMTDTVVAYITQ